MRELLAKVGSKYNMLTILKVYRSEKSGIRVDCICDCGKIKTNISSKSIRSGFVKSCGCLRHLPPVNKTHGKTRTPIHKTWLGMKDRCYNTNTQYYPRYGGRGIIVCEEWHKFENFYADMGEKPYPKAQLDRIDNNGNYCKENCRWTTSKQNNRNRRDNVFVTFYGEKLLLQELAEKYKIRYGSLHARITTQGMTPEEAILKPFRKTRDYKKYPVKKKD